VPGHGDIQLLSTELSEWELLVVGAQVLILVQHRSYDRRLIPGALDPCGDTFRRVETLDEFPRRFLLLLRLSEDHQLVSTSWQFDVLTREGRPLGTGKLEGSSIFEAGS